MTEGMTWVAEAGGRNEEGRKRKGGTRREEGRTKKEGRWGRRGGRGGRKERRCMTNKLMNQSDVGGQTMMRKRGRMR